ncbi:MAG: hypothetical protein HN742_31390 [Lentisphaerae bacterium]|jgi:hypothetical protein|nr:hypothetical protein [Lentisphaerota bacterium]MBT4817342.1 hypothetical protein [Lentisphaerota bacterium]MBT5612951.1 hypothetical protein [Lentisphaerota bacterium]MBT7059029.1 hypothetical protein [Lentisphaerota bacterium]MBT7846416.1 hypothetical protein [Lentisphaerota bacterium]
MTTQAELGKEVGESFVVRPKLWTTFTQLLVVIGIILVVVGAIVLFCEGSVAAVAGMITPGVLMSFIGGGIVFVRRGRGWEVTLHDDGLLVERGQTKSVCRFEEIAALGQVVKEEFANGTFSGLDRQVRIWRKEDPIERPFLDMHVFCKADTEEEGRLAELLELITDRIVARIGELIAGGGTAKAPGVQLSRNELVIDGEAISVDDIAATGLHEGKLCIWRHGQEHPDFRLDSALPNIAPIVTVLDIELERRAAARQRELDGLGRVLFERRASKALIWILLIIGLGTAVFLIGLALLLAAAILFRSRFRCHERGVYRRGLFKEKRLEYKDVAMFSYASTRHYYNGVYTGTNVSMKLKPETTPPGLPTITFRRTIRNMDRDLDLLRQCIAEVVGRKLLTHLAEKGEASWTPGVTFHRENMRFQESKLIGKGEWRELPYEQISGSTLENGIFHLFAKGEEKSILRINASKENFFPGLYALGEAITSREGTDSQASQGVTSSME